MADAPRKNVPVTFSTLEALSWAVWFSAPACPQDMRRDLDDVERVLMQKRREFRGLTAAEPDPLPADLGGER